MNTKILFPLAAGALAGAAMAPSKDSLAKEGYIDPLLFTADLSIGIAGLGLGIAGIYYPRAAGAVAAALGTLLLIAGGSAKTESGVKYVPGILGLSLAGGMYLGAPSLARGSAQALMGLSSLLAVSSTIDLANEKRLIADGTIKAPPPAPPFTLPTPVPTPVTKV